MLIKKHLEIGAFRLLGVQRVTVALILAMLCVGLGTATVISTLSYYLDSAYGFSTQFIGITFTFLGFTGILSNYIGARLVDLQGCNRRKLVITSLVLVCSCLVLNVTHQELAKWLVGSFILLFGIGSFSTSLAYTFAACYSVPGMKGADAAVTASVLRACLAISWVIGPPVGYLIIELGGFHALYLLSAGLFGAGALIFRLYLPITTYSGTQNKASGTDLTADVQWVQVSVVTLATSIIFAVNHAYLIGLPIYLSRHPSVDAGFTGILLGAAALMEIPMIIAFGFLSKHYKPIDLILLGTISGIIFFIGMSRLNNLWQLVGIQVLNAVLASSVSVGGLLYLRNLFRARLAMGSSVYLNTMLAGSIAGSLAIANLPCDKSGWVFMQLLSVILGIPLMLLTVLRIQRSASRIY